MAGHSRFARRSSSVPHAPAPEKRAGSAIGRSKLAQTGRRRKNENRIIENPLAHYTDEELVDDARHFRNLYLPAVAVDSVVRAARVAKDIHAYDEVAHSNDPNAGRSLPVRLSVPERRALQRERNVPISERGMRIVILTVSLAAFLQGHVQSSINGASLFSGVFGLGRCTDGTGTANASTDPSNTASTDSWLLGATNAAPFLFAALLGCPLALPINDLVGRRGSIALAAVLIFGSSIGGAFCRRWYALFVVRVLNGIGMGLKAVSTTILASETSIGYWRGTSILAWQLWVAFGIMIGLVFNLIVYAAVSNCDIKVGLFLGAPAVPALILLASLWFCPESPRYYMRRLGSYYSPDKAYHVLCRLRNTELQALRDLYLVHKSLEVEDYAPPDALDDVASLRPVGVLTRVLDYFTMYRQLFRERRLRNALISSSTVALAQQLCGINVLAFYSGTLFRNGGAPVRDAMAYSLGFGCINFFFGLPAIRTIDTLGRRKWLILTLPLMAVFLVAAVASYEIQAPNVRTGVVSMWLFLFAAAYSPGMGPIPFTLASEREAGCAFAVAVNLLFAGVLSMTLPKIISSLGNSGTLGLFAGLNVLALVLVFLFVEETKRRSLEDLDMVFAVPKRTFIRFQLQSYLPWFIRHYLARLLSCCSSQRFSADLNAKPNLYIDTAFGTPVDNAINDPIHASPLPSSAAVLPSSPTSPTLVCSVTQPTTSMFRPPFPRDQGLGLGGPPDSNPRMPSADDSDGASSIHD